MKNKDNQVSNFVGLGEVVTLVQELNNQTDNFVIGEMFKAVIKMGVIIDEDKLRRWVEMCSWLEKLPDEQKLSYAAGVKIERQRQEISELKQLIENLKVSLRQLLGDL